MFTTEVIEKLGYYVYRLIDPRNGQTFYVGKGKGNRLFAHVNDALKNYEGESFINEDEDEISDKIQQIRDIKNAGLDVIHVIQRYGLTEKEAFEVEAALIDCYPGLTNIQNGFASDRGVNNAEVLQRDLSYEVFNDVKDLKYCIIKIKNCMINDEKNVYESVRKHWRVNLDRMNNIPYVLAAHNGVIIDVFEVDSWYKSPNVSGRCMFDGKPAPESIKKLFINKRLPNNYTQKGMASPVLYHDNI